MIAAWALAAAAPLSAQPTPAAPATAPVSPELTGRAQDVLAVLRGGGDREATFTPEFNAQVPAAQLGAVAQQLASQYGDVQAIEAIVPSSLTGGVLRVGYPRALVEIGIQIEAAAPHRISGLRVAGVQPRGADTAEALAADLRALPGRAAVAIARLEPGGPVLTGQLNPGEELAIGSAFKLVILGEVSRQIAAGRHRWEEVVPLGRHSLPSGLSQSWPEGAPVTIHSLAALMISISDNTATDTLLALVGRENVERMMATMGMAHPERNRPFLGTREAFALKLDPAMLAAWTAADEPARRRLLAERVAGVRADTLDPAAFTRPQAPDRVEWYASTGDLVRIMDWLRRNADPTAQAILAINPGMAPNLARDFAFAGFKGGSEAGVITLTYLLRTRAGAWYVVSGGWNNYGGTVDDARFIGLMARAVQLVR